MDRRRFLTRSGLALVGAAGAGAAGAACGVAGIEARDCAEEERETGRTARDLDPDDWESVRAQFALDDDLVHLSALYLASHPRAVRDAIVEHRRRLDENPTLYVEEQNNRREREALEAAGEYLGAAAEDVALTDSTTMGLGLLYNGLRLQPGQEILTTEHDYYATHESVRLAAERSGATYRKIPLYEQIDSLTTDEIVGRVAREVRPETRAVAVTWVHSSTGVKLPIRAIADALEEANDGRDEEDRVLLCVDGVHGFGVEAEGVEDLGCDFFAAGCHKWLFGPRGTGILWGDGDQWARTLPTIPSFMSGALWNAWYRDEAPEGRTTGRRMSPGGFKPFEHQWSLAPAFEFHQRIGKERVAERTHALARELREGLAEMQHVQLVTPLSEELSSGIVCFDVDGMRASQTVARLRDRGIVGTVTPYAVTHVRLAPCIRNRPQEIETTLAEVRALA